MITQTENINYLKLIFLKMEKLNLIKAQQIMFIHSNTKIH